MKNNLTQPKGVDITFGLFIMNKMEFIMNTGVDIYLLLLCCGKFCVPVRESSCKKLLIRRRKRLGTAALAVSYVPQRLCFLCATASPFLMCHSVSVSYVPQRFRFLCATTSPSSRKLCKAFFKKLVV